MAAKKANAYTVAWDSGLNLREKPDYSGAIVRVLPYGEKITAKGKAENGWLPVDGGYVRSEYLK